MRRLRGLLLGGFLMTAWAAAAHAADVPELLKTIQAVEPNGAGSEDAARAWTELAAADADALPAILAGLDQANPLAANWIRTAIEAVVQRAARAGRGLSRDELEKFIKDVRHDPRGRRLAYELLSGIDAPTAERLLAGMLDDPSLELRRDAIVRQIAAADAARQAGRSEEEQTLCQAAFAAARDPDQVQLLTARLRKLGAKVDPIRHYGVLVHWHAIGPFDDAGGKGYDAAYPPEREIDLSRSYPGKEGEVRWVECTGAGDQGRVDLNKALGEKKGVAGYATTEFVSPKQQPAEIRMASENAVKLWLNGRLVDQHHVYHGGSQWDQYVVRVELQPGPNRLLLKVCQNELKEDWARAWSFQLRICDGIGTAILPAE
jgi:hypothetical protein